MRIFSTKFAFWFICFGVLGVEENLRGRISREIIPYQSLILLMNKKSTELLILLMKEESTLM